MLNKQETQRKKYLLEKGLKTAVLSRLLAKAIDLFIVLILSFLFYPLGVILGIIYLSLADSFQNGQSAGKRIIGFAVASLEDGSPCSSKQAAIRNLPLTIPLFFAIIPLWGWVFSFILGGICCAFELYFLFKIDSGHRLGDLMADTTVIANRPTSVDLQKKATSWFEEADQITPS